MVNKDWGLQIISYKFLREKHWSEKTAALLESLGSAAYMAWEKCLNTVSLTNSQMKGVGSIISKVIYIFKTI